MEKLYIGADNDIRQSVQNDLTEAYITDATVTFAVKNAAGSTITGGTGTCSFVTGSTTGEYRGILDSTASMTVDTPYWVEITITATGGYADFRRIPCVAKYRETR